MNPTEMIRIATEAAATLTGEARACANCLLSEARAAARRGSDVTAIRSARTVIEMAQQS